MGNLNGTSPKDFCSDSDIKKLVCENPTLTGYMDSGEVDDSVKVIHQF